MVLTRRAGIEAVRSVVVPDPEHWTLSGIDVSSLGYVRADTPEHAELLIVPDVIPDALQAAVLDAWSRLPEPRRFLPLDADFEGVPADVLLGDEYGDGARRAASTNHHSAGRDRGDRGGGEPGHDMEGHDHGDMEGQDHHDMMAIVGDPSADGLVMESIDFELGPLSAALPGGLVAAISLDGDVVERCMLRSTLTARGSKRVTGAAGPSATAALEAATARARELVAGTPASESSERRRVAAIELERTLGHAGWFRSFGTVLGWADLADRAQAVVDVLLEPGRLAARMTAAGGAGHAAPPEWSEALPGAAKVIEGLLRLVDGSRRLRARAGGRAPTPATELSAQPIGGPVARAAGLPRDARVGDPLYEELGFEPELEEAGDAAARALVRAREMRRALAVAAAAVSKAGDLEPEAVTDTHDAVTIEGSRGPLRVSVDEVERGSTAAVTAPGAAEVLALAGESVRGLELAAALTGVASFDLSSWKLDR